MNNFIWYNPTRIREDELAAQLRAVAWEVWKNWTRRR